MIERIEEYNALKEEVQTIAEKYRVKDLPIGMMLETQQALINLKSFAELI